MFPSDSFHQNSDSEIDYEKDIISEQIVNLLTDVMRKQYCSYLEKLLIKNFHTWCNKNIGLNEEPPENWIKKCVQMYEMKAIKSCMIAQFYRKSMLKIMENIRHNTINGKLDKKMKLYSEASDRILPTNYYPYCLDATTQTIKININNAITQTSNDKLLLQDDNFKTNIEICNELSNEIDVIKPLKKIDNFIQENIVDTSSCTYQNLSLDDKIELFKDRIFNIPQEIDCNNIIENKTPNSNKRKRYSLSPQKQNNEKIIIKDKNVDNKYSLAIPSPVFSSNSSSPIEQQLTPTETNNQISISDYMKKKDIIETKEDDIAKELDKIFCDETDFNDIFGLNESVTTDISNKNAIVKELEQNQIIYNDKSLCKPEYINKKIEQTITKNIKNYTCKITNPDIRLRDSIWPCELHMQTKNLRDILSEVGIIFGMRFHEKIKLKFIELFGNDDDNDDFAPYSPTIELNDILLSSCKARIAPWIVKYLMIPMKDGLIKDRIIFKKFAKRMANKIVTDNQYPSENDIKNIIANYFILNKRVDNIIEDIDIT